MVFQRYIYTFGWCDLMRFNNAIRNNAHTFNIWARNKIPNRTQENKHKHQTPSRIELKKSSLWLQSKHDFIYIYGVLQRTYRVMLLLHRTTLVLYTENIYTPFLNRFYHLVPGTDDAAVESKAHMCSLQRRLSSIYLKRCVASEQSIKFGYVLHYNCNQLIAVFSNLVKAKINRCRRRYQTQSLSFGGNEYTYIYIYVRLGNCARNRFKGRYMVCVCKKPDLICSNTKNPAQSIADKETTCRLDIVGTLDFV